MFRFHNFWKKVYLSNWHTVNIQCKHVLFDLPCRSWKSSIKINQQGHLVMEIISKKILYKFEIFYFVYFLFHNFWKKTISFKIAFCQYSMVLYSTLFFVWFALQKLEVQYKNKSTRPTLQKTFCLVCWSNGKYAELLIFLITMLSVLVGYALMLLVLLTLVLMG